MKYSLDSNVLRNLAHDDAGAVNILLKLDQVGHSVCVVSAVAAFELYRSALSHRITTATRANIRSYLGMFEVLPFDDLDAAEAGKLDREIKGNTPGENDVMIAGQARRRGLVLVTDNVKDFARVPRLIVENWLRGN